MTDILNIENLIKKMKSHEELEDYCKKLFNQVQALTLTAENQATEIVKLQRILESSGDIDSSKLKADDAEVIARTQLKILLAYAMTGELNTEQAKKVDLYTRLLLALNGKAGDDNINKRTEKLKTEDLIRYALSDKQ